MDQQAFWEHTEIYLFESEGEAHLKTIASEWMLVVSQTAS